MAASGISFAIPSDIAKEFLEGAKNRVKSLKGSADFIPPKMHTNERFYIGLLLLHLSLDPHQ